MEARSVRVRVPGDKSLTQRALILATLAEGESRLSGLLFGGDVSSTAGALRALGAEIPPIPSDGSRLRIQGLGLRGLRTPTTDLDMGNSGTGTRLLLGVLAGSGLTATLTGDASLRSRPMARVTEPLSRMGARFEHGSESGRLPITVFGAHPLRSLDWSSPVASAQVKSAILLAGLTGRAFARVTEPRRSRDHTERVFQRVGASVVSHQVAEGWRVELRDPPGRISPLDFEIPGDISSAAFVLTFAALGEGRPSITVEGMGLNPTRSAFLGVLERMGARVTIERDTEDSCGEPVGDVTVHGEGLRATTVESEEVPGLIDELPLVAVLGARAEGVTRITGAEELRTKECDRISALVDNLRGLGVAVEEHADGLEVEGAQRPLRGRIRAFGDHRIAMAFAVLGATGRNEIEIDEPGVADVSFPGFWALLEKLDRGGAGR